MHDHRPIPQCHDIDMHISHNKTGLNKLYTVTVWADSLLYREITNGTVFIYSSCMQVAPDKIIYNAECTLSWEQLSW